MDALPPDPAAAETRPTQTPSTAKSNRTVDYFVCRRHHYRIGIRHQRGCITATDRTLRTHFRPWPASTACRRRGTGARARAPVFLCSHRMHATVSPARSSFPASLQRLWMSCRHVETFAITPGIAVSGRPFSAAHRHYPTTNGCTDRTVRTTVKNSK
jgi:hypothetical protein